MIYGNSPTMPGLNRSASTNHKSRLRVLYLTHHGPWPTTSGGRLRDAALIPRLARLSDIEVWAVSRSPEIDRASLAQRPAGVDVRVFADESPRRSYPTRDSAAAGAALRDRFAGLAGPDVVHVEGHYLVHLLPEEIRHRAVVVEHNVESHLLQQRAARRGLEFGLAADIEDLVRTEEKVWTEVGGVIALSEEDRSRILRRVPATAVSLSTDGADHLPLRPVGGNSELEPSRPPTFGFLANYAYPPNADALDWLLDEIVPALKRRLPESRLVLAGSNLDTAIAGRALPNGVEARGWVEDLSTFWNEIDVMVCPLRIGGGVKVKVIEAVRSGTLAVSTSVGLEGMDSSVREAVLRADSVHDLVDGAVELATNPALRRDRRARIARAQQALPTWKAVAQALYGRWLGVAQPALGGVAHDR